MQRSIMEHLLLNLKCRLNLFVRNPVLISSLVLSLDIAGLTVVFGAAGSGSVQPYLGKRTRIIPFIRHGNHILLAVRVNDSQPLRFVLDTGASASVISKKAAELAGLNVKGQHRVSNLGTGEGDPTISRSENVTLILNDIRVQKKEIAVISFDTLEHAVGYSIDGILGAEIFKRYVVGLEYNENQLALSEPDSYRYEGRGQALPIELKNDRPFLKATALIPGAEPIEGSFVIDIGAQGTMSLQSPIVEKYRLLTANRKSIEHFAHGAAGEAPEMLVRAESLRLGTFTINNPVVALSTATKGSTADSSYKGVIGAGILNRYRVTILYYQKQLILEPTPACNEPFEADMSGGSLIATGPDFKVFVIEHVVANSPMFEAGLRAGDIITSINGKPAEAYTLDDIREMFKRDGQQYKLDVKRGSELLNVTVRPRKLI